MSVSLRGAFRKGPAFARGGRRGFTLVEVLVALVVFAISVVGLVALESRSIEAQRSASDIREAERIAQQVMSDLLAESFLGLVAQDFTGNPPLGSPVGATFPYDDADIPAEQRLQSYHRPPADIPPETTVVGEVRGKYIVFRTVDWIEDPNNRPSNPPVLQQDEPLIVGLSLDVAVLWIDDTNSAFPPPPDLAVTSLTLEMIDTTSAEFRPFVSSVRMRTTRANDATTTL